MPESFIPVWMSLGEAELMLRLMQEISEDPNVEFPEREFELVDAAIRRERPRSFTEMQEEREAAEKRRA